MGELCVLYAYTRLVCVRNVSIDGFCYPGRPGTHPLGSWRTSVDSVEMLASNMVIHVVVVVQSLSRVSLKPHELQHTRLPCPSLSPRACSNSCPLSQWCHPTTSSSGVSFSSCLAERETEIYYRNWFTWWWKLGGYMICPLQAEEPGKLLVL